jgi:hypothetical protein
VALIADFTDYLVGWGTAGLAVATLGLMLATVRLVGHTRAAAEVSRAALRADVQPLLVDVPPSAVAPPDISRSASGDPELFHLNFEDGRRRATIDPRRVYLAVDAADVFLSVPFRNVGRGVAKVVDAGVQGAHAPLRTTIRRQTVPPGETTRIDLIIGKGDPAATAVADGGKNGSLAIYVEYTDIGAGQTFRLKADVKRSTSAVWHVANVDHDQVAVRPTSWVLDNIAVSSLGMRMLFERGSDDGAFPDRFHLKAPFGYEAQFSRRSRQRQPPS